MLNMNVLSLFDGMSCGQIALQIAGITVNNYFASEIDKAAISVTQHNYPNTIQLGSVVDVCGLLLPKIDLIIGGSPCQDISNLNKFKEGLDGEKSSLFYEYYRVWQECKSKNKDILFLLENVNGNKKAISDITKIMGVKPIKLNSKIVSGQNRNRLYWTNINVNSLPQNKYQSLQDILQKNVDEVYFLKDGRLKWLLGDSGWRSQKRRFTSIDSKRAGCLTKRGGKILEL